MATLLPGARGDTGSEIAAVLGIDENDLAELGSAATQLRLALAPRTVEETVWDEATGELGTTEREAFRLSLATALFVLERYPLVTDFCEALSDSYGADFFSVDFTDSAAAAGRINSWVSERTEGRIPNLVDAETLPETTRLVLANAVYFKAAWASEFSESATEPRPFNLIGGEQVLVPPMAQERDHAYWRNDEGTAEALRLPYDEGLSMLIVLPSADALDEVERSLSAEAITQIRRDGVTQSVAIELPRFEVRYELGLAELLKELGMVAAFEQRADFSGITPAEEGLMISEVLHQAWVRVDEHGTEAAAATAVLAMAAGIPDPDPPPPTPFIVDRPFLFFIYDDRTGAILFQGRVVDPRS